MKNNGPSENTPDAQPFARSDDRRCCKKVSPPPYQTSEGAVLTDRRSHLDRRSTWIKDFSIDGDQ